MTRWCLVLFLLPFMLQAQSLDELTVEKIMRHPKWIGIAPNNAFWSPDNKTVYFYWNPEQALSDSLYSITIDNPVPKKVALQDRKYAPARVGRYNRSNTKMTYEKNGDIFLYDVASGKISQITNTVAQEYGPYFSGDEGKIIFTIGCDAYGWGISRGTLSQLTNFEKGKKPEALATEHEKWLSQDQLAHFKVLNERNKKHELKKKNQKSRTTKAS